MSIKNHDPLNNSPILLSKDKRDWCAKDRGGPGPKQSRIMVFHHAMNTTPRPTNPGEMIGYSYTQNNKFHDREPEEILKSIQAVDPHFFKTYPKKPSTPLDGAFIKGVIGELARTYYRYGLPAYGKPGLRKTAMQILSAILFL